MKSSRLKNFCQLCRKQCRDQNGYVCHLASVSHQKRVQEFATNPQQHIQKYSNQMQHKFIQLLKSKYPGQSKHLQLMFEQYSQEKRAIKFNHTKWKNLSEFGNYLKAAKNIKISGGEPPNCYVTYTVNKTMQFIQKNKKQQLQLLKQKQKQQFEKSLANKIQRQKAFQQRQAVLFQRQMKKNQIQRQNLILPQKLQLNFQNFTTINKRNALMTTQQLEKWTQQQQNAQNKQLQQNNQTQQQISKKLINNQLLLNRIKNQQRQQLQVTTKTNQPQPQPQPHQQHNKQLNNKKNDDQQQIQWIVPNILVKIKPHDIDQIFHNKKVMIQKVVEPYVAEVKIGTATLEIDQSFLQTVIPKINHQVLILIGEQKGKIGVLTEVSLVAGFGNIEIKDDGSEKKTIRVPFNFFSKIQTNVIKVNNGD